MNTQIQVAEGSQAVAQPRDRERNESNARGGEPASASRRIRLQAAILAIAPAVMLAGFLYHPHIGNPTDPDFLARLAAAVEADPVRWAVAHLTVALGSGLIALAFLALRSRLRDAGEDRWSMLGLPFIVLGSVFYALLPAMEFAPLAAVEAGADAAAAQGAIFPWFVPTLFTGAIVFFVGAVAFAKAISRSGIVRTPLKWFVIGAIVIMAAARLVPLSLIQVHVQGAAGIAALWPLAYLFWKRSA